MRRRIVIQAQKFLPKERLSFRFRVSMAGRSAANRSGLLKNGWRNCLYGAFLRPGGCFFAVKTESFSAKKRTAFRKGETFLPQGSSCGCGMKGKTGPRKAFPVLDGVRLRANSVCPFASHSPCRGDEEDGSGRTAFRGGRQNVAGTGFRLSFCMPLGARGSRISVLFPPQARLRGSRRGCPDVLTKCHLGTCCCLLAFWELRDRRRLKELSPGREMADFRTGGQGGEVRISLASGCRRQT